MPARTAPKRPARRAIPPTRSKQAEEVRQRILQAALDLFEEQGFDGTAVPQIAKRAKVATGSIYRYFASKELLVNALYRQWKDQYSAVVLRPPPKGATPRDVLAHYWRGMIGFARTYPKVSRFLDLHHHRAYLDAQNRDSERAYVKAAATFIEEGVASGDVRQIPPMLLLALLTGAMRGLIQFSVDGDLVLDDDTMLRAEQCLWNAIKQE